MKTLIKLISATLFLLIVVSCQKEVAEIIQPPEEDVLQSSAKVTTLVQRTVKKDGSKDNIIDNASCLNVKLPVTVKVNGLEVIVDSEEDYEVIEAIFDEFDDDVDDLEMFFPIVIILSDYSEITINNYDELESKINECKGENEMDDDIECLDFVYPITLSVYDSKNQLTETITINNDKDFYNLIDDIEDYHIITVNFPVEVELYDGTKKTINDMETLENTIEDVKDLCDEDDDNDFDDDDCNNCTDAQTATLLKSCTWTIDKIKINGTENTEQYVNYTLWFLEDGTLKAEENGNYLYGTWKIDHTEYGKIVIKMSVEELSDLTFDWILYEIENDNEVDLRIDENVLELEKTCIEEKIELIEILKAGSWLVANFNDEGESKTSDFNDFVLVFKEDLKVTATKGNDVVDGTWEVIYDSGRLKLVLDFGETIPFDEMSEDWKVVEVLEKRIALKDVDDDTGKESNLIFESN